MKELMEKLAMKDEMSDMPESSDIEAKLEVLKELHEMATQLLGDDMEMSDEMEEMPEDGMEKVTVAAKDKEGLEEGLDVAQGILGDMTKSTGDYY